LGKSSSWLDTKDTDFFALATFLAASSRPAAVFHGDFSPALRSGDALLRLGDTLLLPRPNTMAFAGGFLCCFFGLPFLGGILD
jgi:hypothetical protein